MKAVTVLSLVLLSLSITAWSQSTTKPVPPVLVVSQVQQSGDRFQIDSSITTSLEHIVANVELLLPERLINTKIEPWQGQIPNDQVLELSWEIELPDGWSGDIQVQVSLWLVDEEMTSVHPIYFPSAELLRNRALNSVAPQHGKRGSENLTIIPLQQGVKP